MELIMGMRSAHVIFFVISFMIGAVASSASSRKILTSVQLQKRNTRCIIGNSKCNHNHTQSILVRDINVAHALGSSSSGGRGTHSPSGGQDNGDGGSSSHRSPGNAGNVPAYAAGAANKHHHRGASIRNHSSRFLTLAVTILILLLLFLEQHSI